MDYHSSPSLNSLIYNFSIHKKKILIYLCANLHTFQMREKKLLRKINKKRNLSLLKNIDGVYN